MMLPGAAPRSAELRRTIGPAMLEPPSQPHLADLAPAAPPRPDEDAGQPPSRTVAAHHAKAAVRPPDTIWRANPREQGLLGLTDAVRWFGLHGWSISMPLIDSQPYDLVVDDGAHLHRVQVKTTTHRSPYGVFVVRIETRGGNQSFHTAKPFDATACDLLYVLTDDRSRYLIPTSAFTSTATLNLGERMAGHRLTDPGC